MRRRVERSIPGTRAGSALYDRRGTHVANDEHDPIKKDSPISSDSAPEAVSPPAPEGAKSRRRHQPPTIDLAARDAPPLVG